MADRDELYADSAQAREMDRKGDHFEVTQSPRRTRAEAEAERAEAEAREAANKAASRARVKRAMGQLEDFFIHRHNKGA